MTWPHPLTVLSLLLALAAPSAAPQAPAPRTLRTDAALRDSVEARGARFVAAVNSGDAGERGQIVREIYAPAALEDGGERQLRLLERLRSNYGTLTFHHAEAMMGESGPRAVMHVFVRCASDERWRDVQFTLEPDAPHRMTAVVFIADVAEPVYLPNGALSSPATLEWLDGYMRKLAADDDLAGGLLLAEGERVVFERTVGWVDSARTRRAVPATRFNLGSGGKMFTALLIAQLVEEGRLRFDDPVARHLPALAKQKFAPGVTIAHLLTHTSGIGELWTDEYERHWNDIRRLDQMLPYVLKASTSFSPGERFEYSNSNYVLLGLVIEARTKKAYDVALTERLTKPLGMTETGLFRFDDGDTTQAQRLARDGTGWRTAPHGYRGSSAGGALSTSADMLRFGRALAGGRIVPPAMLTRMTTSHTAGLPGNPTSYGYGFILESSPGGVRSYGHGGIASGVNFEFRYFPAEDLTLIAWSNQDNGAYDDLRRNTIKLITGER